MEISVFIGYTRNNFELNSQMVKTHLDLQLIEYNTPMKKVLRGDANTVRWLHVVRRTHKQTRRQGRLQYTAPKLC